MAIDLRAFSTLTFDCYGTLIDWETGILNALRPLLERHGRSLGADELLELFGELEAAAEAGPYQPYREILATVAEGFGERLGFETSPEERAAFGASVGDWPAFPDSVAGLRALKQHYKLVILSNVDDDLFAASAKRLEVPFDAVVTAEDCGSYKPSSNNFRRLLSALGLPPEEILHVAFGFKYDIGPASTLGMHTAWINRHGEPAPDEPRPTSTFRDLWGVADLLSGS